MDRNELANWLGDLAATADFNNLATVTIRVTAIQELRDALRQSAWRPMSEAPETGVFLVLLEKEMLGSRVHTANWHPNAKIIGGVFSYDAPKPVGWQPIPPPPADEGICNR